MRVYAPGQVEAWIRAYWPYRERRFERAVIRACIKDLRRLRG